MDEKDVKRLIEEQGQEIEVPEKLRPDSVEPILKESADRKRRKYLTKWMAVAVCMVVVTGAAGIGVMIGSGDDAAADGTSGAESQNADSTSSIESDSVRTAQNYDEIYDIIEKEAEDRQAVMGGYSLESAQSAAGGAAKSTADIGAADMTGTAADLESGNNYSETNVREDGIGEADIVKTDGKRIYIVNQNRIQIVGIEGSAMEQISTVKLDSDVYVSEIYIKEDSLVVVYTKTEYEESKSVSAEKDNSYGYEGVYRDYTVAETFSLKNPENPVLEGKISQSGRYNTLRAAGDKIYLFSNYYADMECPRDSLSAYIPSLQGKVLDSSHILMPLYPRGNAYTVITSFFINDPENEIDSKAVFGASGMCYISRENIYMCETSYDSNTSSVTQTCIRKISYKDGMLSAVGQIVVDGTLNDSFSIDEYKGNLRLVTTVSPVENSSAAPLIDYADEISDEAADRAQTEESVQVKDSNTLYILDENLKELSRIEGFAPDESVYSARFLGDTGYFVTFRQIDPLFSVDLSDPENPEIIGQLKIPGFSEYLHLYGEGLLLGIGMDVDEEGITTEGVKISMFDISDPANVQEIEKHTIKGAYSTDAAYNYKAVFIEPEKNLIGFIAYGDTVNYYIFSYEKGQFVCRLERIMTGWSSSVRALYAGEKLYLIAGNTVESYNIETFDKIDDIVL